MKIQFNTDKTVSGNEKQQQYFTSMIADELDRFESHITRIEVHLSDQNGVKEASNEILCLLEARLEGRQPMAVSCQADTVEMAVSGAIDKLKRSLESTLARLKSHQ